VGAELGKYILQTRNKKNSEDIMRGFEPQTPLWVRQWSHWLRPRRPRVTAPHLR